MAILVDADRVSVSRSDRALFRDLSITVSDRDRLGVVGINGTGKSTLLRVLASTQRPDSGEVRNGTGIRIGLLDQDASLPEGIIKDVIGSGWQSQAILDRLGMTPLLNHKVSELSGGQVKRVALAKVLVEEVDLLILDEPTNHLDLAAIPWLQSWLSRFRGGVIVVSHDRYLLDRVTTRMLELDRGKGYLHDGGYATYLGAAADREERSAESEAVRKNLARRELAWLRRGAKARTRKPQARIDAAKKLIDTRAESAARSSALDLSYDTPRLGSKVIDAVEVSFAYDERDSQTLHTFTLRLSPSERMGIVGANGSGKTTLLELLASRIKPTSGEIETGTTVKIGYYSQQGPNLDENARVMNVVAGPHRVPGNPSDKRLMERFWFTGELPWATVKTLSGGERRRLQLLIVLASQPNVLLLDEPTNDLDLDTLRALEEYLDDWPGALVTVSHDRSFLERVTDRVVSCSHGYVSEVPGGLPAWISESLGSTQTSVSQKSLQVPKDTSVSTPKANYATKKSLGSLQFQLIKLDRRISDLTAKRDEVLAHFSRTTDHVGLTELGIKLAQFQSELDDAEEKWLNTMDTIEQYNSQVHRQ